MPLLNSRLIEKHIKSPKPLPAEHEAILTAWAENLAKGIYDSETKNDGQFIQRILVDVLGYSESAGVQLSGNTVLCRGLWPQRLPPISLYATIKLLLGDREYSIVGEHVSRV